MTDTDLFSFKLTDSFVDEYRDIKPPFGFTDAAGNSLGEITFLRTYSRIKSDGNKEQWYEVCQRVIEGMYSIQKDHCKTNRLLGTITRHRSLLERRSIECLILSGHHLAVDYG